MEEWIHGLGGYENREQCVELITMMSMNMTFSKAIVILLVMFKRLVHEAWEWIPAGLVDGLGRLGVAWLCHFTSSLLPLLPSTLIKLQLPHRKHRMERHIKS